MSRVPEKACSVCREVKALGEFGKNRSRKDGLQGECRACRREMGRTYRSRRDPEKQREYHARWARANPERVRENGRKQARRRYERDPSSHRARMKATAVARAARSEAEVKAAQARLRPDGLKKCRVCALDRPLVEFSLDRKRADGLQPECRACNNRGLLDVPGLLTLWEDLDLWRCVYCDGPFQHVDHSLARARGGTDDPENLVPACATCNLSKSDRSLGEFLRATYGTDS